MLLGIVAFALVLVITDPPGPGLDPDALAYLGSAESLAASGSYRVPTAKWWNADSTEALAHFPPGYSTALAIPLRAGMSPTNAARLLQAIAAFITTATLVLLVADATSAIAAILLAVALFANSAMHEVHVSVLSEPMFLACLALTLAAMVRAPDRPLRAGIPAAIGILTRYAGAALVGAVVLWALARKGSLAERLRRAAIALAPAVVLQGAWVLRTRQVAGTKEIRKFALYGNLGATLREGAATVGQWLVPDPAIDGEVMPHHDAIALAALGALAILVLLGLWHAWHPRWKWGRDADAEGDDSMREVRRLLSAAGLLLGCYAGVIGLSRIVADPRIPFDDRILAPALVLGATIAAVAIACWWRRTHVDVARVAVAGALLGWLAAAGTVTWMQASYVLDEGSDLAGKAWRNSALVDWARHDGARVPLYSNWPSALWFQLHRPVRELPRDRDARTLAAFADTLRARGGMVAMYTASSPEFAPLESLRKVQGLRVVRRVGDGVVIGVR